MVATITSFYKFQAGMHSNTSGSCDFSYPPPTGWPGVKRELFSWYDDTVIDLIRHLPYIDDEGLFILPDTKIIGHASPDSIRSKTEGWMRSQQEDIQANNDATEMDGTTENKAESEDDSDSDVMEPYFPEYMLDLAAGGQYGSTILVDTKHNTIIWWEYEEGFRDIPDEIVAKYPCDLWFYYSKESNDHRTERSGDGIGKLQGTTDDAQKSVESDDEDSDDEEWNRFHDSHAHQWKISPAYSPEDFFEMCKEQFRIMNWMPVLHDGCRGKVVQLPRHQVFEGEHLRMKQVLQAAGWPGDGEARGWDKAGAEVAMQQMHNEYEEERESRRKGVARDIPMSKKWKDIVIREGR